MHGAILRSTVVVAVTSLVATTAAQFDVQVNVGADGLDIAGDAANESMLVMDPRDPNVMAVGWRNFTDRVRSNREAGYAFTRDGGWTWTYPGIITHFPARYHPAMVSDPVLAAFADGGLLYASLVWSQWSTEQAVFLSRSSDQGRTWTDPTAVLEADNAEVLDKPWVVVTGDGIVYVSYTLGIYSPWHVYIQRSIDRGRTFTPRFRVSEQPGEHASMPAVGPDGTLYVLTLCTVPYDSGIRIRVAPDAGDLCWPPRFGEAVEFRRAAIIGGRGECAVGLHVPAITVDSGDGPYRGSAYAAYVRRSRLEANDIAVVRSHDRGATWDVTRRVNDRAMPWQRDCFIPTIDVAPDGRVDVAWYDRRDDPDGLRAAIYHTYSIDGGETWQPNVRLTRSFDPTRGYPEASHKIGEYIGIVSTNDELRLVYTASYGGEQNLYCAVHKPYLGDLNGDRIVDFADLQPFVLAARDPASHALAYPMVDVQKRGDLNRDGRVDMADVEQFVDRVMVR
ncbi:MAG: hypothetical protein JXO22_08400 [Phycisphaerae bacterium]|nr:hypothetical protein [Phycisphaerae bacterium]